jgi:activator of 2-hydroxyglutaryl-CoA dehydratase
LLVPEEYAWCGAIGTAILEAEEQRKRSILEIHRLRQHDSEEKVQDTKPLSTENVVQLRDRVGVYVPPPNDAPIPAYLGLDIGSVSTNVVAIDEPAR